MDGNQFDAVTKAAMLGGRREALRHLGLFAGGVAALLGAREVDAQERKRGARTKKRRQGNARAEAKPENPGPPADCCAPCPATGNECTIAVRDASTGQCEQVPLRSSLPCGTRGTCGSDGVCYECEHTLCPAPLDPTGETRVCADLQSDSQHCGSCGNECDFNNQETCCGGTCCPNPGGCCFGTCCPPGEMCFCQDPFNTENCSCQPFPPVP
jgi:hypothetical protein